MVKNANKNSENVVSNFNCIICDYTSCRKYDLKKHCSTLKHKMLINVGKSSEIVVSKTQQLFSCSCGKTYKYNSCLSRHKNMCKHSQTNNANNDDIKELLIAQSAQIIALAEKLASQPAQIVHNIHNNTTQNNNNIQNTTQNNVTFNLNCFLNNTCKDAINMADFISSIQVTFADLENTGKNGFVKSMTQVITRELGKLEECMRPIHCSDVKRKVLHIKEDNLWKKDTETCANTKLMVRKICHATNVMQIPKWVTANPRSQMNDDKLSDFYFKIVGNSMDGSDETYDKIITGVSGKIHVGNSNQMLLLK